MSGYVTLLGAESVENAGHRMSHAAAEMSRAAASMDESVNRLARVLDEFSVRLSDTLTELRSICNAD